MASSKGSAALDKIQQQIWQARIPLEITLSPSESRHYDKTEPYLISTPRLSYLPLLLPRLQAFYADSLIIDPSTVPSLSAYFTHDNVPLKPHFPVGLLYDIHVLSTSDIDPSTIQLRHATPFRLTLHFSLLPPIASPTDQSSTSTLPAHGAAAAAAAAISTPTALHDAFMNSTKEADFLRSGTAKPIMSLGALDSQNIWTATVNNDLPTFSRIFASLLPGASQTTWRNVPLRVYLPDTTDAGADADADANPGDVAGGAGDGNGDNRSQSRSQNQRHQQRGRIRVLQAQVPPFVSGAGSGSAGVGSAMGHGHSHARGQSQSIPQTLGMALHSLLPSLFPSRRTPILAKPLLHGAVVPMNASLEELASKACYADGWINIVVAVTG